MVGFYSVIDCHRRALVDASLYWHAHHHRQNAIFIGNLRSSAYVMNRSLFILLAAALFLTGVCVAYRDLLASAFDTNPYANSAVSAARGKRIYERDCLACHGRSGRGDGPAASSFAGGMDDLSTLPGAPIFPDGVVAYRIANGKDGMPGWKGVLSDNDIWDVLSYVRSLRRSGT